MIINIVINGEARTATVGGWESLLTVLREDMGLTRLEGCMPTG